MAAKPASFYDMGYAIPQAINPVGDVLVGVDTRGAFRWTPASGYTRLKLGPLAPIYTSMIPMGVSADGDTIIGSATSVDDRRDAFIWTRESGKWTSIGSLNGGTLTIPRGINYAGDVVVGEAEDGHDRLKWAAFRWTRSGGIESLGYLNGGWLSQATAVNAAGDVIVGDANNGPGNRVPRVAFRWTREGGMQSLGSLHGPQGLSRATAVNAAGNVVAGYSAQSDNEGWQAFRWTQQTGMKSLGNLNGGLESWASGINASGDVIVGTAYDGATENNQPRAFRWTRDGGMQSVEQWLSAAGVKISDDMHTYGATAVNGDGTIVTGRLQSGDAFIARVPINQPNTPAPEPGLIGIRDYLNSLYAMGGESKLPLQEQRMVLHGAHGSPLQNLLIQGQKFVRANGDTGQTGSADTRLRRNSGEIGVGYGVTPTLQLQLAVGRTDSRQQLPWNGSARHSGTYVLPELVWQSIPDLFVSVSGYYNHGNADIRRGYSNAGLASSSTGTTNSATSSLRLRFDMRNALRLGAVDISPYASITWSRMKMNDYREQGGPFPAEFDARTMHDRILRLGTSATLITRQDIEIDGSAEIGYRINEMPRINVSGTIPGLGNFSISGADTERRIWPRIGLGLTSPLRQGMLSAMLNATKREGHVGYWLASAYSVHF
ncbi:autotransporter domain-containing protein [Herbaspirillum sp. CF444]|uniref:autotransporter domain-containing protein n=1 Tax=Herbaspirillum sp. CF444 TaxID=1144319 RepID=UPI00138AC6D1|nr:autotransporter domain-containing protein [Herbaspirillum sp. CF444]